MHVWDTTGLQRYSRGFTLPVPITYESGEPAGDGVVHDCVGPPVVGMQAGDTCQAECDEGFYGGRSVFTCRDDGVISGTAPTCYHIDSVFRYGSFGLGALALLFLA